MLKNTRVKYTGNDYILVGLVGTVTEYRYGTIEVSWDNHKTTVIPVDSACKLTPAELRADNNRREYALAEARTFGSRYGRTPHTFSYLGKSEQELGDMIAVMEKHDIGSAAQLDRKLSVKAPVVRVDIYDSKNESRLLGSIDRPAMTPKDRYISMCVSPKMSMSMYDVDLPMTVSRADFQIDYRPTADNWSRTAVLVSATPLDLLMRLPSFRLPGEDATQAARRLRYA